MTSHTDLLICKDKNNNHNLIKGNNNHASTNKINHYDGIKDNISISNIEFEQLSPREKRFITKFTEIVANNYQCPTFGVKKVCELMNMSERPIQRNIKKILGIPPNEYIRQYRLHSSLMYLAIKDSKLAYISKK